MEKLDLDVIPIDNWFDQIAKCLAANESFVIFDSSEVGSDHDFKEFSDSKDLRVGIFSSGSTGKPKLRVHDLESLLGFKRTNSLNWMTFYRPDRMAGLQSAIHAWKGGGRVDYLGSGTSYEKLSAKEKLRLPKIDYISGTPSHFRQIDPELLKQCVNLNGVTFGGELVTQQDINRVKMVVPQVTVFQIYASSEFGAMCTVKDELAGLPLSFFNGPNPRFKLDLEGELYVRPFSVAIDVLKTAEPSDVYFKTGDLGVIENSRFYFTGRKDSLISVGGVLASPEAIESALMKLPEVISCRVLGKSNAVLGAILIAEIVPMNENVTSASILAHFSEEPIWKKPHLIKFCESIEISTAGKVNRNKN